MGASRNLHSLEVTQRQSPPATSRHSVSGGHSPTAHTGARSVPQGGGSQQPLAPQISPLGHSASEPHDVVPAQVGSQHPESHVSPDPQSADDRQTSSQMQHPRSEHVLPAPQSAVASQLSPLAHPTQHPSEQIFPGPQALSVVHSGLVGLHTEQHESSPHTWWAGHSAPSRQVGRPSHGGGGGGGSQQWVEPQISSASHSDAQSHRSRPSGHSVSMQQPSSHTFASGQSLSTAHGCPLRHSNPGFSQQPIALQYHPAGHSA